MHVFIFSVKFGLLNSRAAHSDHRLTMMFSEYLMSVKCFPHLSFWSRNFVLLATVPEHCLV